MLMDYTYISEPEYILRNSCLLTTSYCILHNLSDEANIHTQIHAHIHTYILYIYTQAFINT